MSDPQIGLEVPSRSARSLQRPLRGCAGHQTLCILAVRPFEHSELFLIDALAFAMLSGMLEAHCRDSYIGFPQ
jgi:hypothetical protein